MQSGKAVAGKTVDVLVHEIRARILRHTVVLFYSKKEFKGIEVIIKIHFQGSGVKSVIT